MRHSTPSGTHVSIADVIAQTLKRGPLSTAMICARTGISEGTIYQALRRHPERFASIDDRTRWNTRRWQLVVNE